MKRKLLLALLATAAALTALYALAGFALVPWLVQRQLPALAAQHIEGQIVAGRVTFNPFLLRAGAHDLKVLNARGDAVLSAAALSADMDWSSLWSRRWTFDSIRVEQPQLRLRRMEDGSIDLVGLIMPAPADPSRPRTAPPSVLIRSAAVIGGSTAIDHHAGAAVVVEPLELSIEGASTAPGEPMSYTLQASLRGGGAVASTGELAFAPLAANGDLRVGALALAGVWPAVRELFAIAAPGGTVDLEGRYSFADGAFKLAGARVALKDLVLAQRDKRPLLRLAALNADGVGLDTQARSIDVASLALRDGAVHVAMAEDGALNWAAIVRPAPRDEAAKADDGWAVRIAKAGVEKVALRYDDRARAEPLAGEAVVGRVSFGLALAPSAGAADLSVERLDARLDALSLTGATAKEPLVRVDSVALQGGSLSTRERRFTADALRMSGGGVQVVRTEAGRIELVDRLLGAARPPASSGDSAAMTQAAPPWRIALGNASLEGFAVGVSDRSFGAPIGYDVQVSALRLSAIGAAQPVAFEAALRVGAEGRVDARGTFTQDAASAAVTLEVADVPLVPLAPLVARHAALDLRSGLLSASAKLAVRRGETLDLSAEGRIDVAQALFNEAGTGNRFLSWKLLQAEALRYASASNRLTIGSVVVREPGAKLEISRDRQVNVMQVVRSDAPAAGASPKPAAKERAFAYRVERLRVAGGVLDFADYSLALPFATRVQALAGGLTGLSSEPDARARVNVEGRIEPFGAARARGTIALGAPTQHTNIRAEFDNVPLPPLSPYSITFAGRRIDGGRLWLDARYAIDRRVLTGSNDIRIADLKLGERVESRTAIDLPLDLAIALLTDERGRIEIAVPIEGDLDNPRFGYAKVIGEALLNVLKRAVSAPFRLLGRLVGAGGEEGLQAIEFEPGRARLRPPEEEKLHQVATALRERPLLKLIVSAAYDVESDRRALARERVRAALRKRGGEAEQGSAGPVAVGSTGTQEALERLFIERVGVDALNAFVREFEKGGTRDDEGASAATPGRGVGDFYAALFRRLAETESIDEQDLQALARERADAIVRFLTGSAASDAARVEVGEVQADRAGGDSREVRARLSLQPVDGRS